MSIRVLVIDDSPTIRFCVCRLMERNGIETLQARSPLEALTDHLVDGHDIDAVITDLRFAGRVGGEELIEIIQQEPSLGFVPVVVLTSFAEKELQLRCFELGASAFIAKLWDDDLLVAQVRMLAKDYQRRRMTRAAIRAG